MAVGYERAVVHSAVLAENRGSTAENSARRSECPSFAALFSEMHSGSSRFVRQKEKNDR